MALIKKKEDETKEVEAKKGMNRTVTVEGGFPGDDFEEQFRWLNILLHGSAGHGKSTIAVSACKDHRMTPVLILDVEGGAPFRLLGVPKDKVTVIRLRETATLTVMQQLTRYYELLRRGKHPYKTVIIDSLSELQKRGLKEIIRKGSKKEPITTFLDDIEEPEAATQPEYGQSHMQMTRLVRYFQDLPMHVIFTSISGMTEDEKSKTLIQQLSLPAKQGNDIAGNPDIVGCVVPFVDTETKNLIRRIHFQPSRNIIAKDRTHSLGLYMDFDVDDPIMTRMLDAVWTKYGITEENEEEGDE